MTNMLPAGRPRMNLDALLPLVRPLGLDPAADRVFVVGVRGYYRDTMGAPGVNDRGIYDDAIFLVSPSFFGAYNGNTDPSRVRKGAGFGSFKGMASLKAPQLCRAHRFGLHRGKYMALIQTGGPVTVMRDGGDGSYQDTGWFGINIHKGGFNTTSSEGCQTVHPSQWPAFIGSAQDQARRYNGERWRAVTVPYALLEGVG